MCAGILLKLRQKCSVFGAGPKSGVLLVLLSYEFSEMWLTLAIAVDLVLELDSRVT